jgi:hypothetical protein
VNRVRLIIGAICLSAVSGATRNAPGSGPYALLSTPSAWIYRTEADYPATSGRPRWRWGHWSTWPTGCPDGTKCPGGVIGEQSGVGVNVTHVSQNVCRIRTSSSRDRGSLSHD